MAQTEDRPFHQWYATSEAVLPYARVVIVVCSKNPIFYSTGEDLLELLKDHRIHTELIKSDSSPDQVAAYLAKFKTDIVLIVTEKYELGDALRHRLLSAMLPPLGVILIGPKPTIQKSPDKRELRDLRLNYDRKTVFCDLALPTTDDQEQKIITTISIAKRILLEMADIEPFQAELVHHYQSFVLQSPE